ncbi:MAG: TonB-dependent receptor [Tannerellaceae bacterium]|jgi:TonB-dependent receptor|nr:TonB-dependent receptor [Tannerellaceae bacterium]
MKKMLLLWLALLSCGLIARGQSSGVISGTVTDATENRSLPGAILRLDKYNRYTISDQNGYYEFLNVPAEGYSVEASYMGYKPETRHVEVISGGNSVINLVLTEAPMSLGEVVVMGDGLRGQAKALNTQKTNDRITNVISADQIGRFPDANIGDALKRVPGIATQGDQGEARNIVIRGLAPQLNSVTLNGNRIPSAEGDNRNVQMDLIPADMVQAIEVSKTLTADMDADAIGGSVNLITRAATGGQRISVTVPGGYNPIREGATHGGSLVYGNRFFNDKLGVVASGSYQNKDYGSDNAEAVWAEDDNGGLFLEAMDIRRYDVQRIRRSIALNTDWKINPSNTITFDAIYNWRDDLENRFRLGYEAEPEYDDAGKQTGYIGEIQREDKAGIGSKARPGRRLEIQTVQSYALGGQHLVSPKFDLDWNLSYARGVEEASNERYITFTQEDVKIVQDISNPERPFISSPDQHIKDFSLDELTENNDFTAEDELAVRINARAPLSVIDDQKGRLRFGFRGRFKSKERDNDFTEYEPAGDFPSLADQALTFNAPLLMDERYIPGSFFDPKYVARLDLKNSALFEGEDAPDEYMADNYKAGERILAGYLRWDQNFTGNLVMTLGVRAEHTHMEYEGNFFVEDEFENARSNKFSNDYLDILPSLSFKWDVRDNLILRAAFTTSLARPNYYDLVPFANINREDREIEAGNSSLAPTYSYNFDLMGEYYFKPVGLFSIGGFCKSMKDFAYFYSDADYTREKFARDFPGMDNPIDAGERWELLRPMNGENVDIFGFEVAFQRKLDFFRSRFLRNFGAYLNYTYTGSRTKGIYNEDGEQRTDVKLPGTAPHMFNASLSWENKRLSARVSLNYTGNYIDEVGGSEFEDVYYDRQLFLDANASYRILPYMRVFAEANNLTNQPLRYYQSGVRNRLVQMEYYKPTFNLGLKFDI